VKAGQLMAEIDIPEIDAELNESRAQLQQIKTNVAKAQADYDLAQSTWNRYDSLARTGNGAVTEQDLAEKLAAFNQAKAALDSARAAVTASEAAVQRLMDMQSFAKVTAPFGGIVSARNYDIGALLSPTNAGDGKEMFRLTQADTLRVFVNVPQSYASSVKLGQPAGFTVRNFPGKVFEGKVTRTTGAIDPNTRTLRMQVDIPNPDLTLWAGMYGQVKLAITPDHPPLIVPTSAMMFKPDGTIIAVAEGNRVHLKKVTLGRDFGTELEVVDGLNDNDKVVSNPGERLSEGIEVQVLERKEPSTQASQGAGK
jgi:RND family efflux transporter MFP subunit